MDHPTSPRSRPAPWRFAEVGPGDAPELGAIADLYAGSPRAHWLQHPQRRLAQPADFELFALLADGRCDAFALARRRSLPWLGKALYFVERGPVYRTDTAAIEIVRQLRSHLSPKAWMIEVSPFGDTASSAGMVAALQDLGFHRGRAVRALYTDTITLDLDAPLDTIRKGFRRSLKTQINRFERVGLEAGYRRDKAAFERFCAMVNRMAADRGLKPIGDADKAWLLGQLGELFHLFVAELDGEFKGGILLVSNPQLARVIYEYGGSIDEDDASLPVGHGLHWKAIQWAKQAGYRHYDFGGFDRSRGDAFSINRFKLGFSKSIEPMIPELRWMPGSLQRWGLERYLAWKSEAG